jgi:hypothetical protein
MGAGIPYLGINGAVSCSLEASILPSLERYKKKKKKRMFRSY